MRRYSLADRLIGHVDQVVRTLTPQTQPALRANPAQRIENPALNTQQQSVVAGLMRVNHTGEVCAQALYHGQALTAKLATVRQDMEQAALEEQDHLAWCEDRLRELNSQPSLLNPLWYGLSFGIGALAGIAGDKWSLGFVAETEKQVCAHLTAHMQQLPSEDHKTHAILQQMHSDEDHHRQQALAAGGVTLPPPVQQMMQAMSKVMTKTSYYV
ncbi:2-polyprenyl-3-methyl-6-methoxy-1,4-benzoquinone monooxygenase [Agitococcus lubricus]|uniref:3-demethoxyubiquinol 3-hydroxylase n=1 Tax=Agitococcus lubricus TaxID=1077255 RepID=A0A2T5J141_9GAMM|nr:2-polyprenyl-3-methyl-6-methoxy-1,4-benzoquinone monooxygenase [Agitococcus lubricus]PTQ90054.1 ubiquinone biosynthesis monooxygenase Coq7 [Agitococcus lubricus]